MTKTLLVLSNASGYGGAERNLELLAANLSSRYRLVVLVENQRHAEALNQLRHPSLEVVPFRKGKGAIATLRNLALLQEQIVRTCPLAILANTNKGALYLALRDTIYPRWRGRFLLFVHDFQWRLIRFIYWRLKHSITIVPTQAVLEKPGYINQFVCLDPTEDQERRSNARVLPNLVAVSEQPPRLHAEDRGARRSTYVLCPAAVCRLKGLHLLIRAFSSVTREYPELTLVVCGEIVDRDYRTRLSRLIDRLGLNGRVEFRGFCDDIDSMYRGSLYVVNASLSRFGGPESFGRTIVEAWSHGKPAIAFRCGGPKYLIADGKDGYLVQEGDVEKLGDRMLELVADDSLRNRMGIRGYEKVIAHFAASKLTSTLCEWLDDAGSAARPPLLAGAPDRG